jgi:hypothetical protein
MCIEIHIQIHAHTHTHTHTHTYSVSAPIHVSLFSDLGPSSGVRRERKYSTVTCVCVCVCVCVYVCELFCFFVCHEEKRMTGKERKEGGRADGRLGIYLSIYVHV